VFENEGILVGDYRKGEGLLADPDKNITLWVLPEPIACLLCRLIIYGKPIEVRLAEKLISSEAAFVHRTILGASNGKALKSTALGDLTNSALAVQGCPGVHDMRHIREFFSMEIMEDMLNPALNVAKQSLEHWKGVASVASNHDPATSKAVYSGVFEKDSVAGLRKVVARDRLQFSRRYNEVVLGYPKSADIAKTQSLNNEWDDEMDDAGLANTQAKGFSFVEKSLDLVYLAQRLNVLLIRPFQASAVQMLLDALPVDTKIVQAPTSMGKDLLPFALAVHCGKAQLVFVPFVALVDGIVRDGSRYSGKVVKLSDIGKTITIETAAATADIIVCSYEHAQRALRLVQELQARERLGKVLGSAHK